MNDMDYKGLPELPPERRWRRQIYPAPIVVALIRRQFRRPEAAGLAPHYLLIKRKDNPYNGQWALVGGKWDFGETLSAAILREVKEETDLDASFVAVRGLVSERVVPPRPKGQGAHFLIFVCDVTATRGDAEEQEEGAVDWFTQEQIEGLRETKAIIPSDYAMLTSFAGSQEAVPHVEAEMRATIGGAANDPIQLQRFERIKGLDLLSE